MEPELKEEPKAQEEVESTESSSQDINKWVSTWGDCV
jgi:hypothetical protein